MSAQAQGNEEKANMLREIALQDTIRQLKNENNQLKTKLADKERQIIGLQNSAQDYQRIFLKQREELLKLSLQLQEYSKEIGSHQKFKPLEKSAIATIDNEAKEILANRKYRGMQESPFNRKPGEHVPVVNIANISPSVSKLPNLFLEKQDIFKKVKQHFNHEREKNLQEMYSEDFYSIVKKKKEGYLKMKQGLQERFQNTRNHNSPHNAITKGDHHQDNFQEENYHEQKKPSEIYSTPKRNSQVEIQFSQTPSVKSMTPSRSSKAFKDHLKINYPFSPQTKVTQSYNPPLMINSQMSESIVVIPKNRLQILTQETILKRKESSQKLHTEAS